MKKVKQIRLKKFSFLYYSFTNNFEPRSRSRIRISFKIKKPLIRIQIPMKVFADPQHWKQEWGNWRGETGWGK